LQNGLTPLILAAYYGQIDCCKSLVLAGASLITQADGKTAAEWAIEAGHEPTANLLFDADTLAKSGKLPQFNRNLSAN
jgi:ankyrin repeat protein